MVESIAIALLLGSRMAVFLGAAVATDCVRQDPVVRPAEPEPAPAPSESAEADSNRWHVSICSEPHTPAAPRQEPRRFPRSSIADSEIEMAGAEGSDANGFLDSTLAPRKRNLSVTYLPPPPGWTGPLTSIQFEVTITPPTYFAEKFFVQIPWPLPATPQPALIVFHKYGSTHLDVIQNTDFPDEANARRWFLVCPLGASKKHFSSIESQANTEAVLQWLLTGYGARIDSKRLYGVGFSMGGGAAANYAARHLDPDEPMLAAIVVHSGGVALNNTYFHEIPAVRAILDFWFGDGLPGSADPWQMARSSVIDFDPFTLVTSTDNDLARNLMHVPLQLKRAQIDAIHYVNDQTDALHQHLLNLGRTVGNEYSFDFVPEGQAVYGHSWDMLDFSAVCDWLAQFSLCLPSAANTLADRDDTYFHFEIEQDQPGAFTPFSWSVDATGNALSFDGTQNLARATVRTLRAGLDPALPLTLTLGTQDGLPDEIVLTDFPAAPSAVMRDGGAAVTWSYDALARTLTVHETDGATHVWQLVP
jgi:pimeloyl-ACP methyl ester carboxylesterase